MTGEAKGTRGMPWGLFWEQGCCRIQRRFRPLGNLPRVHFRFKSRCKGQIPLRPEDVRHSSRWSRDALALARDSAVPGPWVPADPVPPRAARR